MQLRHPSCTERELNCCGIPCAHGQCLNTCAAAGQSQPRRLTWSAADGLQPATACAAAAGPGDITAMTSGTGIVCNVELSIGMLLATRLVSHRQDGRGRDDGASCPRARSRRRRAVCGSPANRQQVGGLGREKMRSGSSSQAQSERAATEADSSRRSADPPRLPLLTRCVHHPYSLYCACIVSKGASLTLHSLDHTLHSPTVHGLALCPFKCPPLCTPLASCGRLDAALLPLSLSTFHMSAFWFSSLLLSSSCHQSPLPLSLIFPAAGLSLRRPPPQMRARCPH